MLPKKNRANTKEVEEIFRCGRFVNSPNLTLKFIYDKSSSGRRMSFVAPKTTSKSAVKRNLLRRRGYASLSRILESFPVGIVGVFLYGKKGLEMFGQTTKTKKNISINALNEEVESILKKLK